MQRILITLFFVTTFSIQAQIRSQLYVNGDQFSSLQFSDSVKLIDHINKIQVNWLNDGFFFSGIDSVRDTQSEVFIYLHKGEKMSAQMSVYKGRKLQRHLSRQLRAYSNGGYPFASIRLDSTELSAGFLSGKIGIDQGPEIRYDSAYFSATLKTNHSYIYQLLDIVPGNIFSEKEYRLVDQKIERSSFLSIKQPSDVAFENNKAKTFLDLREETSNTFQGVIGLQGGQDGTTTTVGAIEMDIQNLFHSGKRFKFAWKRFAEESQNLSIFYKHPFFLESKISPSFKFDLLKQDTTFLTRRVGLGVHTYIAPRVELFLGYETTRGTLLLRNVETIKKAGLGGFQRRVYSLQLSKGHLEALGKLTDGVIWSVAGSGGMKNIEKSLILPDSYYDTIQIETDFYRFEATLAYQRKMLKRQAFFHHIQIGVLKNDELLENERYRLGGSNSLRGFNEKHFFAESYVLSRAEFRSFFESRSYAYIFYDQLFFSRKSHRDHSYGLGLGFALDTSVGQFSFALAGGQSGDQNISFSTMKIHFGYISRF